MTGSAARPSAATPRLLAACVFVLILGSAYVFTHVFSGRGAFIHVGVFVGTIMAANVFMVIIPNQRKITAALIRGETPDPRLGAIGKQRSLHNTYLTLPVLLMMISNHFAMLTDAPNAWLLRGPRLCRRRGAAAFPGAPRSGRSAWRKIAWTLPVIFVALGLAWWLSRAPLLSLDWANLLIRWGHMIAGIAWIGTSFYFVALDFSLRKHGAPADGRRRRGLGGPWRRLLSRAEISDRTRDAAEGPDLVQVGGLSHLGHRLPAARSCSTISRPRPT